MQNTPPGPPPLLRRFPASASSWPPRTYISWTLLTPKVISGSAAFTSTSENETERSSAAMLGWVKTGAGLLNWLAEVRRGTSGDGSARLAGLRAFGRGGGTACGDVEAGPCPGMPLRSPFIEPLAPL